MAELEPLDYLLIDEGADPVDAVLVGPPRSVGAIRDALGDRVVGGGGVRETSRTFVHFDYPGDQVLPAFKLPDRQVIHCQDLLAAAGVNFDDLYPETTFSHNHRESARRLLTNVWRDVKKVRDQVLYGLKKQRDFGDFSKRFHGEGEGRYVNYYWRVVSHMPGHIGFVLYDEKTENAYVFAETELDELQSFLSDKRIDTDKQRSGVVDNPLTHEQTAYAFFTGGTQESIREQLGLPYPMIYTHRESDARPFDKLHEIANFGWFVNDRITYLHIRFENHADI